MNDHDYLVLSLWLSIKVFQSAIIVLACLCVLEFLDDVVKTVVRKIRGTAIPKSKDKRDWRNWNKP